jgi:hypothetical protein
MGDRQLGQVIFGVRDLDAASDRFTAMGFEVLDGGIHPGVGTANRIIPLGSAYLELLGVVDVGEAGASGYGRALLAATADGDRLVRWSLRTDAIDEVAARLGLTVEPRRRHRPDGVELTWRAAGLDVALADGTLPFFMQWDRPEHYPGLMPARHPNGARRVAGLALTPSDRGRLVSWTDGADAPLCLVDASSPGLWSVSVDTADGEVLIGP